MMIVIMGVCIIFRYIIKFSRNPAVPTSGVLGGYFIPIAVVGVDNTPWSRRVGGMVDVL